MTLRERKAFRAGYLKAIKEGERDSLDVVVKYLTGAPTRDRRPTDIEDFHQEEYDDYNARAEIAFDVTSFASIANKIYERLTVLEVNQPTNTPKGLSKWIDDNNNDPGFGYDLIEKVYVNGKVVYKDDYVTELIKEYNEEFFG